MASGMATSNPSDLAASTLSTAMLEVRPGALFGPADDLHEIREELGNGAASRVFACQRRQAPQERLAVKAVDLRRLRLLGDLQEQLARLDGEVQILRELCHERIVNLRGFHKTDNWYFLVMELVEGGELFDLIVRSKSLSEPEAQHVFLQILEGVGYMHARGVIHRDLKPENILVASSRPTTEGGGSVLHDVKIADFGLSKAIGGGASLARTRVGTPQYWAPEVLDVQRRGGSYDHAADFWGLGAILFVMLCGRYPFDGQKAPLDEQIRTASYSMTGVRWRNISEEAKSLVRGLLRVNPEDRLSLEECMQHPWVTGEQMPSPKKRHGVLPQIRQKVPQPTNQSSLETHDREEQPDQMEEPTRPTSPNPVISPADRAQSTKSVSCYSDSDCDAGRTCSNLEGAFSRDAGGEDSEHSVGPAAGRDPATPAGFTRNAPATPAGFIRNASWRGRDPATSLAGICGLLVAWMAALPRWVAALLIESLGFGADREAVEGQAEGKEARSGAMLGGRASLKRWGVFALVVAFATHSGLHRNSDPPGSRLDDTQERQRLQSLEEQKKRQVALASSGAMQDFSQPPPSLDWPPSSTYKSNIGMDRGADSRQDKEYRSETHSFQIENDASEQECAEQETIFRLTELLKLQVSIVGSLEMALLAFRRSNVDENLAHATYLTSQQARHLFKKAASVISGYAEVASHVSRAVLPDLQLAVEEQEPALAISLLDGVKSKVADMKRDGEVMRLLYGELQGSVLGLAQQAQQTKQAADLHLAQAVMDAASEAATHQRSKGKRSTSRGRGPGHRKGPTTQADGKAAARAAASSTEQASSNAESRELQAMGGRSAGLNICQSPSPTAPATGSGTSAHVPSASHTDGGGSDSTAVSRPAAVHLNALTQRLFDQLSRIGGMPDSSGAASDALVTVAGSAGVSSVGSEVDAWQRNVIDLLFLAPGIAPQPHMEPLNSSSAARGGFDYQTAVGLQLVATSASKPGTGPFDDETEEEDEEGTDFVASEGGLDVDEEDDSDTEDVEDLGVLEPGLNSKLVATTNQLNSSSGPLAVVAYSNAQDAKAAAEKAARSSASLLRALRELRRVDTILEGCFVFWANMDGTVQRLGEMKEHAERLVGFASSKPKLRLRFEQRLKQYASFWLALEQLCRQYGLDHQLASSKMRDFIREVSDAADLVDTAESARAGARAGVRAAGARSGRSGRSAGGVRNQAARSEE